jgi:isopenicillin N synthase-like dioxygenase
MHGTFVVNVGDFLQMISNDIFVSTIHRVRNLSGFERYSIPFFFSFNMDVEISVCFATFLFEERIVLIYRRFSQVASQKKARLNKTTQS